jgi:hypothetical protein
LQPNWNARRLGARFAPAHPGSALNGLSWYLTVSGSLGGSGASGLGGTGTQPARSRISANLMWIIYLEVAVALALAGLIVWWTWPKGREKSARDKDQ